MSLKPGHLEPLRGLGNICGARGDGESNGVLRTVHRDRETVRLGAIDLEKARTLPVFTPMQLYVFQAESTKAINVAHAGGVAGG